jgi:hypothetical protein
MRRGYILSILLTCAALAAAQTSPIPDTIAQANVVELNPDSAKIQIVNSSDKDISAYTVLIEEVYQDGHVNRHERSTDGGPNVGTVIAVGHSIEEPNPLTNFPKNPVIDVRAKLILVVFSDLTAYVASEDAFQRVLANRRESAEATREVADIIQRVTKSEDAHPSQSAIAEINQITATKQPGSSRPVPMAFSSTLDDLKRVPELSSRLKIGERDYLNQLQVKYRGEADKFAARMNVRKVNQ